MKLVIIGATGRNGRRLVERAHAAGHEVTAFAPDPSKLGVSAEWLVQVPGDVLEQDDVKKAVTGSDAVVFAIGVRSRKTTTTFSDGIRNTVEAMETAGVRRLVCVSAALLDIGGHLGLPRQMFSEFVIERIMRNIYLDLARMEDEVALSDLDYTVVRSAAPADGPATGGYRSAIGGHLRRPKRLSRADLADYIVRNLTEPSTFRAVVEVAN